MEPDEVAAVEESLEHVDPVTMESPISGNIRGYYKGFSIQITCRDPKKAVKPLLDKLVEIANYMELNSWKPSWNPETNAKVNGGNGYTCNVCGSPANYKGGVGAKGPWKGVFCTTEKNHVTWIKDKKNEL